MKIFLILLISILPLSVLPHDEGLNITGSVITYLTPTIILTEGPDAPDNPNVNDLWRNTDNNTLYKYDGSTWIVKNLTQDIKDEIAIFKTNLSQVSDPRAKKCLRSLGKAVLKLYQESLE